GRASGRSRPGPPGSAAWRRSGTGPASRRGGGRRRISSFPRRSPVGPDPYDNPAGFCDTRRRRTMRVRLPGMLLVLAAGLGAAAEGADDKAKAELKKLEGTWLVKTLTVDGQERTDNVTDLKMVVKPGGEFVVRLGDKELQGGVFTVQPDKKPKWVDNKYTSGV